MVAHQNPLAGEICAQSTTIDGRRGIARAFGIAVVGLASLGSLEAVAQPTFAPITTCGDFPGTPWTLADAGAQLASALGPLLLCDTAAGWPECIVADRALDRASVILTEIFLRNTQSRGAGRCVKDCNLSLLTSYATSLRDRGEELQAKSGLQRSYGNTLANLEQWSSGPFCSYETGTDRPGSDYANFAASNPEACKSACEANPVCLAWTYVVPGVQGPDGRCWLKDAVPSPTTFSSAVSGVKSPTTTAASPAPPSSPTGGSTVSPAGASPPATAPPAPSTIVWRMAAHIDTGPHVDGPDKDGQFRRDIVSGNRIENAIRFNSWGKPIEMSWTVSLSRLPPDTIDKGSPVPLRLSGRSTGMRSEYGAFQRTAVLKCEGPCRLIDRSTGQPLKSQPLVWNNPQFDVDIDFLAVGDAGSEFDLILSLGHVRAIWHYVND